MAAPSDRSKLVVSVLIGAGASAVLGVMAAVIYLIAMRVVGVGARGMDGLALAASLVVFPVAAVILSFVWMGISLWRRSKGKAPGLAKALALGTLMGLLAGLAFAGPNGFTLRGGAPAFNYALAALGAIGASSFELAARKLGY